MNSFKYPVHGVGLGLRRVMLSTLADQNTESVNFWEVAPENWINVAGRHGKQFRELTEKHPVICHGLSLSIGSPAPLDETFLQRLKQFLKEHRIRYYSEHLSYCSDDGHLYDLMPIPFTEEAVRYVAERIRHVQDMLDQRIAMENISYYAAPGKQMEEIDFLNAVLEEADCDLLLDVNNIYVNSINHRYDAEAFLRQLPAERIRYIHVAGHYQEAEDLLVDTHGSSVIDPVWQLLEKAYQHFGVLPTLLERDFNIPALSELLEEAKIINHLQAKWLNCACDHIQHARPS
ncbi:MAG TPA: DUF692 domain-containing protein [Nitrosomonas sp.]|nr:DUF692 domain-containing protein [Nitrosomonas sp.]HMW21434.1 DUF692 domain-containing protein [Nitrosomonas sp.]HMW69645.1 DUF692 domain-containing protein [Nitrosomonas sp.]HMY62108.1 DUF692 domain-containing protein [Nitrosomonas sp.]HMY90812.1 DUF692 domain-containing protein [Nitrosomonas sp.]